MKLYFPLYFFAVVKNQKYQGIDFISYTFHISMQKKKNYELVIVRMKLTVILYDKDIGHTDIRNIES